MRQKTVITKLLQRVTEVYYKVWQTVIAMYVRYYRVWQDAITKCVRYYKVRQLLQSET